MSELIDIDTYLQPGQSSQQIVNYALPSPPELAAFHKGNRPGQQRRPLPLTTLDGERPGAPIRT